MLERRRAIGISSLRPRGSARLHINEGLYNLRTSAGCEARNRLGGHTAPARRSHSARQLSCEMASTGEHYDSNSHEEGQCMSEAPIIPYVTRQPFELSDELGSRIDGLGLASHLDQLRDEGYAIVPEIASPEFTARLREVCLRSRGRPQSW